MTPPQSARGRLKSIDFLRGCAALAVVCSHAVGDRVPVPYSRTPVLWRAHVVMSASGRARYSSLSRASASTCVGRRMANRRAGRGVRVISAFWKRRLHRLYRPYLVMLCASMSVVGLCTWWASTPAITSTSIRSRTAAGWRSTSCRTFPCCTGISTCSTTAAATSRYWTLAREEYLYLIYFAVLAWRRRCGLPLTSADVFALGIVGAVGRAADCWPARRGHRSGGVRATR